MAATSQWPVGGMSEANTDMQVDTVSPVQPQISRKPVLLHTASRRENKVAISRRPLAAVAENAATELHDGQRSQGVQNEQSQSTNGHDDAERLSHSVSSSPIDPVAQQRISELEAQVEMLTGRATDADYETQVQALRTSRRQALEQAAGLRGGEAMDTTTGETSLNRRPSMPATSGRFASVSSFLARSRSVAVHSTGELATGSSAREIAAVAAARENELTAALAQERDLREQAENRVGQMSTEIEDLSTSLFQQANEMVATERRARANLEARAQRFEERCGVLEEKVRMLEKRDADKRRRLERLEEAIKRCERVRVLLQQNGVR